MDVCFSRRQVNMKRMNEEQLFHLGKDLIPLGDPRYTLIIQDKTCLGPHSCLCRTLSSCIKALSPEEIVFILSTNSLPSPFQGILTGRKDSMGHAHKNPNAFHLQ